MLVVPRLIALMLMLPLLTIIADIIGLTGGMWIANVSAHITYGSYIDSVRGALPFGDVLKGLLKSVVFAVIVAVIGSYSGLQTRGGAAGVGKSTTEAVVISIILIFVFNFALSYLLFPH
jgi:phospholipid/cholesterol/gamma-HCH transport system permease protein